jgi:hypothetical protein
LPDLFLIQTIDNDIRCDGTDPQNYAAFGAALTSTLRLISTHDPNARILLVTQPGDGASNAGVAATNPARVKGWQGDGPCDAFTPAGKLSPAHVAGLQDIADHYFAEQEASCKRSAAPQGRRAYRHTSDAESPGPDNLASMINHRRMALYCRSPAPLEVG